MNVFKSVFLCTILFLCGCAQPNKELNNTAGLDILVKAYSGEVTNLLYQSKRKVEEYGNRERDRLVLDSIQAFHERFLPCYAVLESSQDLESTVLMDSLVRLLPSLSDIGVNAEGFSLLKQDSLQFLRLNGQSLELNREDNIPFAYLPLFRILVQLELLDIEQNVLMNMSKPLLNKEEERNGLYQAFVSGDRSRVLEKEPYRVTIDIAEVLKADSTFLIDGEGYLPNDSGTVDFRFIPTKKNCIRVAYELGFIGGERRAFEGQKCYSFIKRGE